MLIFVNPIEIQYLSFSNIPFLSSVFGFLKTLVVYLLGFLKALFFLSIYDLSFYTRGYTPRDKHVQE